MRAVWGLGWFACNLRMLSARLVIRRAALFSYESRPRAPRCAILTWRLLGAKACGMRSRSLACPGAPPPARCACMARDALSGLGCTDAGPGARVNAVVHVGAVSGLAQFGVGPGRRRGSPRARLAPATTRRRACLPAGRRWMRSVGVGCGPLRRSRRQGCREGP